MVSVALEGSSRHPRYTTSRVQQGAGAPRARRGTGAVKAPRPPRRAGEPALRRVGAEIAVAQVCGLALHQPGPERTHTLLAPQHRDEPELLAVQSERVDGGREASGANRV